MVKNLGLQRKAKHYLNKISILVLYYSFINSYINYGNLARVSINRTNHKKSTVYKKLTSRLNILKTEVYFEKTEAYSREVFRESKILNAFQLNILNNLVFML